MSVVDPSTALAPSPQSLAESPPRSYRYLDLVTVAFVVSILAANVTSAKLVQFGPFHVHGYELVLIVAGGTIFFPVTFLFGDILTEVYGFSRTRRVIWIGFASLLAVTIATMIVQFMPAPGFWQNQAAYEAILGVLWRTNLAGLVAYLVGEFFNSMILSKLKVFSSYGGKSKSGFYNRHMAKRFVLSTTVGQCIDSAIFITAAFGGVVANSVLLTMFLSSWIGKVIWEIVALPLTLPLVRWLKRKEGVDVLDTNVSFNPFQMVAEPITD